jgi:hypothetical protein
MKLMARCDNKAMYRTFTLALLQHIACDRIRKALSHAVIACNSNDRRSKSVLKQGTGDKPAEGGARWTS